MLKKECVLILNQFTRAEYQMVEFCHIQSSLNLGLFQLLIFYFASIAPVAASPLLGYGDLPGSPLSIIDLHGTRDTVVPNTLTQALGILDVRGQSASFLTRLGFFFTKCALFII